MEKKKKLGLIGAVVLTLLGTVALVAFVRSAEDRALADTELASVIVATEQIPAGTPVEDLGEFTEIRELPVGALGPQPLSSLGEVAGLVTTTDIYPDEQLSAARLGTEGQANASVGGIEVPTGMLEVTINVGAPQAVGGTIQPGDLVALTASTRGGDPASGLAAEQTGLVLHKLLVLNVQGDPLPQAVPAEGTPDPAGSRPQAPASGLLITLAVDAGQLQKVVFAQEYATIWLAREGEETPELFPGPQTGEGFYG